MTTHVTPAIWGPNLQHPIYATDETYRKAAAWLRDCQTIADWGGGTGHLKTLLPWSTTYRVIDGTRQLSNQALADLTSYREPADGIVIRHVLELNEGWRRILENALAVYRQRMVVVTFTPAAEVTRTVKQKSGWPIIHFNRADLIAAMGPHLVAHEAVLTTHPEHVYYCERVA